MKMTDSENSQPQDDSDEAIYKDIPEFNFEDELAKLEESKEIYRQEANDLSEKVKTLTEENKELKKSNEVLKKNLSTLLKTAQAEVQRKDSMIEELRNKVESLKFGKNKKSTNDKITSTEDLKGDFIEVKHECEKLNSANEKKRSKSNENCTSSDSEQKSNQEEKISESQAGKKKSSNYNNGRKSEYYRENTKNKNSWQSENSHDSCHERHKERKSAKYVDSSGQRRSFREGYRDYLYDSYDKKHSRSSDNRFLPRRRSSRERRHDQRKSDSCERRNRRYRKEDSAEVSKRVSRREKNYSENKESSLEKPKFRSSIDNDPVSRNKEGLETKAEASKSAGDGEFKKWVEYCEKKRTEGVDFGNGRSKQSKEKISIKSEKRKSMEMFSTKSPLVALYNDMVASRANRFKNSKPGIVHAVSAVEEVKPFSSENGTNQADEDWSLSFKNERKNEVKPMTLYSRRMLRKFSSESKETERMMKKNEKEKSEPPAEKKSLEKTIETEKEPGELTDDENIIESSKEFQELTKVAAIESEMTENPEAKCFKDPITSESIVDVISDQLIGSTKLEEFPKHSPKESEKVTSDKEDLITCKDIESSKETHDVIEYSPFKNNYKLIEISPIKPTESEHILNFYNKKLPPKNLKERSDLDLTEEKAEEQKDATGQLSDSNEKNSGKNSSSNNNSESELKIVSHCLKGSLKECENVVEKTKESECQKKEEKEQVKKKNKKSKDEISTKEGKRKSSLKNETEKSVNEGRSLKRKRKFSETEEENSDPKKLKVKKNEPLRKSARSKRSSKNEAEGKQETEAAPLKEWEIETKEDISSFEFFKPIARAEPSEKPNDALMTDYKMTTTLSVTSVVRLETPNKCVDKLRNQINEQMIFNVFDPKNNSQSSPFIGSKSIEMTPRRMLKNDLMLTDSEDDSTLNKKDIDSAEVDEWENAISENEFSDCDSDSGASDFIDLL